MKIVSSEVNMEAHVHKEFEVSVQSTVEFHQTFLGFVNQNNEIIAEPTQEETQSAKELQRAQEIEQYKKEISEVKNSISKMILELILEKFLGVDKEEAQMKTKEAKTVDTKSADGQLVEMPKMLVRTDIKIEKTTEIYKKDTVDFSSKAVIKTADKDFEIDLNVSYSQEFYEKHQERIEMSEIGFIDPLVIQYDKETTAFDFMESEMNFKFDLDADGVEDDIPMLKQGNGFLALDKNDNGSIDNGHELFGPNTNDGFAELRAYDSDGNGWIDETDPIFNDLKIWSMNEEGEENLLALGQSGVGAIFLGDIATDMMMDKSATDPLAHLKSTSMFVREDGTAGLLSSLDFIA